MARTSRPRERNQGQAVVRALVRDWTREARSALPPQFRGHARVAVREGLLALTSLCEEILRRVEMRTQHVSRRLERIPVTGTTGRGPRKRRARGRRKR